MNPSLWFFDGAHQNFLSSPYYKVRKYYRVAELTICLHFAGEALVGLLTPALEHLEIGDSSTVDLTIAIWDGGSLQLPWGKDSYAHRGKVIGYNSERIHTLFDSELKLLQSFDTERNLALFWIQEAKNAPWWIGASPLQYILHWALRLKGFQLTHAAAVGYPDGGVLLAGKSGAGKSTTTLSCMKAGMKYVSEDYCVLSELHAYSIYNSAKIEEKTLRLFPNLEKHIENPKRPEKEKGYLFHHKFQPENILKKMPLKALIVLQIDDTKNSRLEPISPNVALGPLSVSTLWQLSHTGPQEFNHLKRVAEALGCYRLHLGSDLTQAPQLIGKIL